VQTKTQKKKKTPNGQTQMGNRRQGHAELSEKERLDKLFLARLSIQSWEAFYKEARFQQTGWHREGKMCRYNVFWK